MKIAFMGSPEFAVPALEACLAHHEVVLVVTQPDKPAGRGKKLSPPPVKVVAERAGVPIAQPKSARTGELLEALRATHPDICVVVAYGKILPKDVLEAAPHGCLNIHGSLLPKYRGAAPIQWAVIDGEAVTGVAIMQLDEGMDTGPVFAMREVPIEDDDTSGTMYEKLAPVGAELLLEVLAGIAAGTAVATAQDEAGASHARMLKKTDGAIDWSRPAAAVASHVRGMDPWPGAYTDLDGERVKLFGARVRDGAGAPGEVLGVDTDGMAIACGDGVVVVAEIQAPGKRRMPVDAFTAGRAVAPGTVLGQ